MGNSSARSVVEIGTVVAGTYTVEALIGKGGMGSVYLASHNRLPGKQVAIKMLHADLLEADVIARFKREAEIASRLGHPNIVGVHDFNLTDDGTPYLVLEYLQGESLSHRLRNGPLPLDTVFSIARQVGSALAAAHREGIVHRDLKPGNIFLVPTEVDGKLVEIAKVLDFGISKMKGSTTVKTQETALLGTPQYMAPEQAKGDHDHVDARTDVFALGAIVYEMLCGHPAFSGETIPEVVFKVVYEQPAPLAKEAPQAPADVVATVNQAMMKSAAERFSSVSTFIEKLTGEKVTLVHRTPSMPPPGDETAMLRSSPKAFANTIDSADISLDATMAPQSPLTPPPKAEEIVRTSARTIESVRPDTPIPIRVDRAGWKLPVIAIGGAAVGALILFFVMRGGGDKPAVIDAAVTAQIDAAPAIDAQLIDAAPVAVDAQVIDAAPVAVDAQMIDAAPKIVRDAATAPEPDDGPEVKRAAGALDRGDYATAATLANEVINSPGAGQGAIARARAIRGAASCFKDLDTEVAQTQLRQIPGRFGAARALLIAQCKKAGVPLF